MGRIVRCKTPTEKQQIRDDWQEQKDITKTAYAAKHGISLRTLSRILQEDSKVDYIPNSKTIAEMEDEFTEEYYDLADDIPENVSDIEWNYMVSRNDIVVFKGSERRQIHKGYPKFHNLRKILVADPTDSEIEQVYNMMCMASMINDMSEGDIHVKDGIVYYGTFEIKNSLSDHLVKMLTKGDSDIRPFAKFMNKLMANPKEDIVEELFGFMKHQGMSIDNDGDIIAYKGVTDKYLDQWTKTIDNSLGAKPVMPRSKVEHDPARACAPGLHCGSYPYACGWSDREIKVKVDPRNVCSVPWDCDSQKMRTCGYEVIEILS